MERTIYRFILRHSRREQVLVVLFTLVSFPFLYVSLDLPKTIINEALAGGDGFPVTLFGVTLDQIGYLLALSALFLALVCVNGLFKFQINVFKGQLGERMLRRLRYILYARVLRFPLPHFRRVSQGEIIPMITAEVEPLGGFVGDSIALPVFQGGTLLTILAFMFVQDWILGLAAITLYPLQGYLIPRLQRRVNQLGKERVRNVRVLSDRIGESIAGAEEIHANDGARLALARFTHRLGVIYDIRYEIYRRKFLIKFLNNFIAQLTPFFFYSIGGVLVIKGHLSIGALVAVLAAYKDLSAPWKELLGFYQRMEDARIKYQQVVEQFDPPGMLAEDLQRAELDADLDLAGPLAAANLSLRDEEGEAIVDGLSFQAAPGERLALVGPGGGGKEVAAMLLARLLLPSGGRVSIAGTDMAGLPEALTGRRVGYVGPAAFVFAASLRENLLLGAMHRPDPEHVSPPARLAAARISGNAEDDPDADWLDYPAIGVPAGDGDALTARLIELLRAVDLEEDVYGFGLRGAIDPAAMPELAARLLAARGRLRARLADAGLESLIEPFDEQRYNTNATVAENLLFGTPVGPALAPDGLAGNAYVREVLDATGLTGDFVRIGRDVAATMVELFADLPPEHAFFTQFSFISAEDLPEFQLLLTRAERLGLDGLAAGDRDRFLALPFRLIPARHRLGLIDAEMQTRLLQARARFAEGLPATLRGALEPFSAERCNAAASLQDNILFAKIAHGHADAAARVGRMLAETIEEAGLRDVVTGVGLSFAAGVAGARLTAAQRQKLAIARVLLRRPDILILNEATAVLDSAGQARLLDRILEQCAGRIVVWALNRAGMASAFDRAVVIRGGRVVESGTVAELNQEGTALRALIEEEQAA